MMERGFVGVDLGGTKILGLLLDARAQVYARVRRSTPPGGNTAVSGAVVAVAAELVRAANTQGSSVHGVAICAPGFVEDQTGTIYEASNLAVRDLPLGPLVAAALGLPTLVMHDVAAAALGEVRWGAARGAQYVACCNIGTGIGVGLVLDGRVYRGALGRAGEFGHIVVEPDGPPCTCGKRGCLEAVASGSALVQQAREMIGRVPRGVLARLVETVQPFSVELIARAAAAGDTAAQGLLARAAERVGVAVAGLIHTLALECVVFSGGVAQIGEQFMEPLRATVRASVFDVYQDIALPTAVLGTDAGAIGAVAALLERDKMTKSQIVNRKSP